MNDIGEKPCGVLKGKLTGQETWNMSCILWRKPNI